MLAKISCGLKTPHLVVEKETIFLKNVDPSRLFVNK
jgi:hypothetical protein